MAPKDAHALIPRTCRNIEFYADMKIGLLLLRGKSSGREIEWEFGIRRCKLLYIEWINNNILLYSPGNYIQYPEINHNGKECEKVCAYMYN